MEHECFNDPEVAELLNGGFVAVKVDREERPDVDHLYMTAVQALVGQGGWPMTLLLTPELEPFFAGTYIPKPQLLDLLERAKSLWDEDREGIIANARDITASLSYHLGGSSVGVVGIDTVRLAADRALSDYDHVFGGFGGAPKFPTPLRPVMLLRAWKRFGKQAYLHAATDTLRKMRHGGMYDQVGFGFHRYSTDRTWTVPHFEKMLYDQALCVLAYLEAFEATREPFFAHVAEEVLTYVDRDLSDEAGGFHSAEDADSEGVEGKFYVWTDAELREVLGSELGAIAQEIFETTVNGNFQEEGLPPGSNVLRLAPRVDLEGTELANIRSLLLTARRRRNPPLKDDKVLADWNGLMIAAFARAGIVLGEASWTNRAIQAAEFVLNTMSQDGRLLHVYRGGKAKGAAGASDYGFMLWGLTELIQATRSVRFISAAVSLADTLLDDFEDAGEGGFFMASTDADDLFVRAKEFHEGAIPAGNGACAYALFRLHAISGEGRFGQAAARALAAFGSDLGRVPEASTSSVLAIDAQCGPTAVCVGVEARALRHEYVPNATIFELEVGTVGLPPFLQALVDVSTTGTFHVCHDGACDLPTSDPAEALTSLTGTRHTRKRAPKSDKPFG